MNTHPEGDSVEAFPVIEAIERDGKIVLEISPKLADLLKQKDEELLADLLKKKGQSRP